jgi:hypothetical protein
VRRSRECLASAARSSRLAHRQMERPSPVSQFCLALAPDGAR